MPNSRKRGGKLPKTPTSEGPNAPEPISRLKAALTVSIDAEVHRDLKLVAVLTKQSVSAVVEAYVKNRVREDLKTLTEGGLGL